MIDPYVQDGKSMRPHWIPAEYTLFVNAYNVSKDSSGKLLTNVEPSFVQEVVVHENYSETSLVHDIALLRLNESVPFGSKSLPQPICVPMDPVNDEVASVGHALRCFGWGYNAEGVLSTTKLWVTLQRISLEDCLERFSNMPSRQPDIADVSERNICTVTISGHDAYAGYSGGPLMYHKGGRWFLIGVISYGVGAISNKFPVVSTNVQQYTDWILSSDRCVGSVITDRHVLTAAHCLDNKLKDEVTMYFGIYDLQKKDKCLQEDTCLLRKPSEFIIHDEYISNEKNNDIAIIRFDQPLNTTARAIEPICLPHNIAYDEQTLNTTRTDDGTGVSLLSFGWGDIGGDVLSHTRRAVRLNVIAGSECENSVNSKTMCTLGVTAGHDVCNGDSGAPLVWLYDKKMYVVGVVTSGPKCGIHYNRTSTAMSISHYMDWVLAKIGTD
ncbi:clotting factor B-like [Anopheles ziemanni]|uniref:clotting factor B-like n=1 Tax=Anopheles coustani TaxID=139045 RepID=UPI0026588E13|nr:clotting factor B-like [Anopheles coustani]XP_058170468.1 clotting factor B-like [Anopheles ziemanni]